MTVVLLLGTSSDVSMAGRGGGCVSIDHRIRRGKMSPKIINGHVRRGCVIDGR